MESKTDPSVLQVGADYLIIEKYLIKTFYEIRNDYVSGAQAGSIKNHMGIGLSRFLQKKVTVALEYIITNYEAKHATYKEKSVGEFIIGVAMKF
ncbi:hypothetical protein HY745_08885 [Candidatus Desantisbacteria bacterium]|nr:hypothetical protein [Candidatus Desantisbacteria bacterium]